MTEIVVRNPQTRSGVNNTLNDFARTHGLAPAVVQALDLALEEHLTNVFNYGYPGGGPIEIRVEFTTRHGEVVVEVADNGMPFDPLQRPEPDLSVPLELRPIGGLGIHFMRTFLDGLDYRRENDRNILTMRKRLA